MKRLLLTLLTMVSLGAFAQSADKLYEEGKKLYDAKNYTAAFPKLKAAAEKGHKKAQYRLGRCYDKGNGTTENDQLAFQWYEKSARQGHAKAQYQLGKCYCEGKGVERDDAEGLRWLRKASDSGSMSVKKYLNQLNK